MKARTRLTLAAVCVTAAAWAARGQSVIPPQPGAPASGGPDMYVDPTTSVPTTNAPVTNLPIEICFVIDTTGSMTRLLQGAKDKVWSIANSILSDNPNTGLKMGIVAYRDRGDEYITKDIELTDDLDSLYQQLLGLQAKGGGDAPESVNQALQDAVEKISWSRTPTIRLIFLVGDFPPHMDYADDTKYPEILARAKAANIYVNAIQCGHQADTEKVWREIASTGGGVYFALEQSGNVTAMNTPQDKKLLELNAELAKTVVPYGSKEQQAAVLDKADSFKKMPLEAAAARVAVNSLTGGRALQGKGDIVQDMQKDKELLAKLKPEELPANMQTMTVAERQTYLDAQLAKRKTINEQIATVTKERDVEIAKESARLAAGPAMPGSTAGSYRGGAAGGMGAGGMGGMGGGMGGGGMGGGGGRGGSFDGAVRAGAAAGRAAGGR